MSDAGGTLPVDEEVRRVAREALDRSLLLEAGAGTGKTTLLLDRMLHLVARKDVSLERLVAITFTDKAAAEMRVRLREELERGAAGAPPRAPGAPPWSAAERDRFRRALDDLPLASIATIHAFAASLIRERPVEAGVDPGFAVLDAIASSALFDEVWSRWEAREILNRAEPYRRVLAGGVARKEVRALARQLLAHRELGSFGAARGAAPGHAAPLAMDAEIALLLEGVERIEALEQSGCRKEDDGLLAKVRPLAAKIRALAAAPPEERETILAAIKFPGGRLGNKKDWDAAALEDARAALAALAARHAAIGARCAADVAVWLGGFVEAFQEEKARRGVLDFHDLLLIARNLLRDRSDVRDDFLSRFDAVLVDEFQDVDPLQAEIVLYLSEERARAATWEEVATAPGRLFVVGDPKQSIYRFRRADIDMYLAVRERLAGDGPLRIVQNFRSVPGIVSWVNGLFERLFAPSAEALSQAEFAPIVAAPRNGGSSTAGPAGAPPRAPILVLAPPPGVAGPLTADAVRDLESAAIAEAIARGIHEGWARPRDAAILFRALGAILPYEEALDERGIPYHVEGGRAFFEREEVAALVACLTAIDDPEDPVALVAALRSPHFGISDESLALLAADREACDAAGGLPFRYLDDPGPRHAEIAESFATLRHLHARRLEVPLHRLVEDVLESTRALEYHAFRRGGRRAIANLVRVAEKARAFEALGPTTLRAFLRWLDEEAEEAEEGDSPIAEANDDLVTLMSIHKAKGLEFGVVALANLLGGGAFRDKFLVEGRAGRAAFTLGDKDCYWRTAEFKEIRENEKRRQVAEERRVLYVATTRAKERLILPVHAALLSGSVLTGRQLVRDLLSGLPGPEAWREGSAGDGIEVVLASRGRGGAMNDDDLAAAGGAVGEGAARGARGVAKARGVAGAPGSRDTTAALLDEEGWLAARRETIARARAPLRILTSRRLHPPERAERADDETESARGRGVRVRACGAAGTVARGAEREAAGRSSGDAEAAIALGAFVHAVLEALSGLDEARLEETVESLAAQSGFDGDRAEALALLRAVLRDPAIARARRAPRLLREVPFAVRLDGRLAEGVIDLLFEEEGGLVIVDYKTDRVGVGGEGGLVGSGTPVSREILEAHAEARGHASQAALYAHAVYAATGRPIREAILLYARAGAALALPGEALLARPIPEPVPADDREGWR